MDGCTDRHVRCIPTYLPTYLRKRSVGSSSYVPYLSREVFRIICIGSVDAICKVWRSIEKYMLVNFTTHCILWLLSSCCSLPTYLPNTHVASRNPWSNFQNSSKVQLSSFRDCILLVATASSLSSAFHERKRVIPEFLHIRLGTYLQFASHVGSPPA